MRNVKRYFIYDFHIIGKKLFFANFFQEKKGGNWLVLFINKKDGAPGRWGFLPERTVYNLWRLSLPIV